MVSTPSSSQAAASATLRSAHTADRWESCRGERSPTAKASRYGGIGWGISKRSITSPSPATSRPSGAAAISARRCAGTVNLAPARTRMRAVSCSGASDRAWIGWHWL